MSRNPKAGFVYLHGFASSPQSNKAKYFTNLLLRRGARLEVPDLNHDVAGRFDFENLTVTRMLDAGRAAIERARAAARVQPAIVLGSSLGGYGAALLAARDAEIAAVVLLAPAFEFGARLAPRVFPGAEATEVYHHGLGKSARIRRSILDDALRYETYPAVRCPVLVAHGVRDESVPVSLSRQFAAGRDNVTLMLLDDDHQLLSKTEVIGGEVERFLAPWL